VPCEPLKVFTEVAVIRINCLALLIYVTVFWVGALMGVEKIEILIVGGVWAIIGTIAYAYDQLKEKIERRGEP